MQHLLRNSGSELLQVDQVYFCSRMYLLALYKRLEINLIDVALQRIIINFLDQCVVCPAFQLQHNLSALALFLEQTLNCALLHLERYGLFHLTAENNARNKSLTSKFLGFDYYFYSIRL